MYLAREAEKNEAAGATADSRGAALFQIAGLVAIALATLMYHDATPYPGVAALLPAFGTVGLAFGVTANLNRWGPLVLMVGMFVGRIGILLLLSALYGNLSPAWASLARISTSRKGWSDTQWQP